MNALEIESLHLAYGAVEVLKGVTMHVAAGEFFTLLGPSGCGKTTLLRCMAGLADASSGVLRSFGRDITRLEAERRGFGMVFQSLALFPHLNVRDNITFPLRRESRARRAHRADELLELVQLQGLADRSISQISGGQAQRVALARALAQEPSLLLLDEPFSALDAKLREALRRDVKIIQKQLQLPVVLVTHDQEEAMAVSDRIAVMRDGAFEQVGSARTLYNTPCSAFVASFLGSRNALRCSARNGFLVTASDQPLCAAPDLAPGKYDVFFEASAARPGPGAEARVLYAQEFAHGRRWCVDVGGGQLWLDDCWVDAPPGDGLSFTLDPAAVLAFPADG